MRHFLLSLHVHHVHVATCSKFLQNEVRHALPWQIRSSFFHFLFLLFPLHSFFLVLSFLIFFSSLFFFPFSFFFFIFIIFLFLLLLLLFLFFYLLFFIISNILFSLLLESFFIILFSFLSSPSYLNNLYCIVFIVLKVVSQSTLCLPESGNCYSLVFQNACPNLTCTCPRQSGKCLCSTQFLNSLIPVLMSNFILIHPFMHQFSPITKLLQLSLHLYLEFFKIILAVNSEKKYLLTSCE